jgi:TonB family protein
VRGSEIVGFWTRPDVRRAVPVGWGLLGAAILLLSLAVVPGPEQKLPTGRATGAPETGEVSVEAAKLRATPDADAPRIATLPRGTPVRILEHRGLWVRVGAGAGQGFLEAADVESDSARSNRARRAATIFKFAPLPGEISSDTPAQLGPFAFAPRWGELRRGTDVEIYSVDHDYYAIRLPDESLGFIASRDVDLVPANPSEPALTPESGRVVRGITVAEETPPPSTETPEESGEEVPPGGAAPAPEAPFAVSTAPGGVAPAVLESKVDPVYPPAALAVRAGGTVVLDVSIDASGTVSNVDVKRSAPLGMTDAAVAAVRLWRYRPAQGPSGPIPSIKRVRIEFQPPG